MLPMSIFLRKLSIYRIQLPVEDKQGLSRVVVSSGVQPVAASQAQ